MHFPLKAVADAGGWKDVTTLVAVLSADRRPNLARSYGKRALRASAPERFARHRFLITQSIIVKV